MQRWLPLLTPLPACAHSAAGWDVCSSAPRMWQDIQHRGPGRQHPSVLPRQCNLLVSSKGVWALCGDGRRPWHPVGWGCNVLPLTHPAHRAAWPLGPVHDPDHPPWIRTALSGGVSKFWGSHWRWGPAWGVLSLHPCLALRSWWIPLWCVVFWQLRSCEPGGGVIKNPSIYLYA